MYDRVKVNTSTAGTGPLTLGAAEPGFRTFAQAGVPDGKEVSYTIEEGTDWETGKGIHTNGVLTRNFTASSTGALLNLKGKAKVFITVLGQDLDNKLNRIGSQFITSSNATSGFVGIYEDVGNNSPIAPGTGDPYAVLGVYGDSKPGYVEFGGPLTGQYGWLGWWEKNRFTFGGNWRFRTNILIDESPVWHAGNFDPATKINITGGNFSGIITTPSMRVQGSAPSFILYDTDSTGTAAFGDIFFWDSNLNVTARFGKPFGDGNLYVTNLTAGSILIGLSTGTILNITSSGLNITGNVRSTGVAHLSQDTTNNRKLLVSTDSSFVTIGAWSLDDINYKPLRLTGEGISFRTSVGHITNIDDATGNLTIPAALTVTSKIKFLPFTNNSPSNGEIWFDGTKFKKHEGGVTSDLSGTGTSGVTLNALTFSDAEWVTGTPESGTINGATTNSTITGSGIPAGLTVNYGNRTWSWDGTGSAGSGTITLTETLAGASNSGRQSNISYTITAGTGSLSSASENPQFTSIPREGEPASVWGGVWSPTPTHYRFTRFRNGVQVDQVVQTGEEYRFDWVAADVGTVPSVTVAVSNDNQTTWSTPVNAPLIFTIETDVIEPKVIPAGEITRTSAAGVLPLTFSINATVYQSFLWQIRILASDFVTQKYIGYKAVSETELDSPFSMDLSGATAPAPYPSIPTLLATDIVQMRLVTQDWVETTNLADSAGVAGPWMAVSATDHGGSRYWKLNVLNTAQGLWRLSIGELELARTIGGANIALDKRYIFDPRLFVAATPFGGGSFASMHIFNNDFTDRGWLTGADLPGYIIIDMGIPYPLAQLRITSHKDYFDFSPKDFQFGPCDASGVYTGVPPVDVTNITWSSSAHETKSWSF